MALVDAEEGYGPAVAVRRKGIELTGATIGAVAVAEFEAMDFPCGHCLLLRRDDTALPSSQRYSLFQKCGARFFRRKLRAHE
jgi:hypothetical protein